MTRKSWIILGMVALLIAGGGAWYYLNEEGDMQSVGQASAAPVYQPLPTDHTFGNPKAKVTVIEYASPTCPVCANFMTTMYPKLKSDYIDKGRIFYVYRTFLRNPDDASAEKTCPLHAEGQIHVLHRCPVPQSAKVGLRVWSFPRPTACMPR